MRHSLLLLLLSILSLSLTDAVPAQKTGASSLVAVAPRGPGMLRDLQEQAVELVTYDPETGVAYLIVDAVERRRLSAQGYDISIVESADEAAAKRFQAGPDLGAYHTYAEMLVELEALAANYPEFTRLVTIGNSYEGRPIYALKISDDPEIEDASEPDVLIVGNHHARELMSVEVPLHLARYLLEQTARNRSVGDLVRSREIWIVPMLNPDGHVE